MAQLQHTLLEIEDELYETAFPASPLLPQITLLVNMKQLSCLL